MNNDELIALSRTIEVSIVFSELLPEKTRVLFLEDLKTLATYGAVQQKRNNIKVVR